MKSYPRVALAFLMTLGMLGTVGCQNYGFEELPTSVIREKRHNIVVPVSQNVDILFVIDNSGSMAGEQAAIARSFSSFTDELDENFGGDYHIAVVTTGMESEGCRPCPPDEPWRYSCINETGESGRFQDLIGHNNGTAFDPDYVFTKNPDCRVMNSDNVWECFYDTDEDSGVVFVGIRGCGYERGLAPIRAALSDRLLNSAANSGFFREEAILAVVVISDEEDCGEVGDISENLQGGGNHCYYAQKGVAPNGDFSDPTGKPYELTSVREYYDFLMSLKDNRSGMVKFAAIVGVEDPDSPLETEITYVSDSGVSDANFACEVPGCAQNCDPGDSSCVKGCHAYPGTRYIELASMFGLSQGENGFVDTICQEDFSETLARLGTFVACPRVFNLSEPILDPGLANILINGEPVPRYSCSGSTPENLELCENESDTCSSGECVKTWIYEASEDPDTSGGRLSFADHYDPCSLITEGEINIEVVYATQ